ncbi:uncharacterized protein LOC115449512 [Manduca sexta]|uniref:Uncharacterized protein n=1 Tax=Manduca sexta TaxID=7130 RepID=A0A922CVE0_MANSE|nr:uncharacterized protein LOC115449512 [Manduca sexta]KAG6459531.1 hypothetical protein O3G_MSEX011439 [Manduca sexta]
MSPRKQPPRLFKLCVKKLLILINSACYDIERTYPENMFDECERKALALKSELMSLLPYRLFDVLCSERTSCQYRGDPRIQLHVLTHPYLTVFRKSDLDNGIPHQFWIDNLCNLNRLVVLDLKFICTDEILAIIGANCLLLEEINIVSKLDYYKSPSNASVLARSVSNVGLASISNLKQLRKLAMDPPKGERAKRIGRCVSQDGIARLVKELPLLEELKIESCDISSLLRDVGPLRLTKINCYFPSAESMAKIITMFPCLKELSVTNLSIPSTDEFLTPVSKSDLRLSRLELLYITIKESTEQFLTVKGMYLTHLSLWEHELSLTMETLMCIGKNCPHLNSLCLLTMSKYLIVPRYFRRPQNIFQELETLTIGTDEYDINNMLCFFLDCTNNVQKLVVKYQSHVNINDIMSYLLQKGRLRTMNDLWLDCTLQVSKDIVKSIVQLCENLQTFTVNLGDDVGEIQKFLIANNYDLKLGSY